MAEFPQEMGRLREEQEKVVTGCEAQILHWKKVEANYEALQERLSSLPDKLSYNIMVPFGPLAFMPGKLVHTNEVTVLLGDNWFAKCSAKQAVELVEHRKKHVRNSLDDLHKVAKNFGERLGFTQDLERLKGEGGDYVDIREQVESEEFLTKGKKRVAHKPNSKPKVEAVIGQQQQQKEEEEDEQRHAQHRIFTEEELWARLDELEAEEARLDEQDRISDGMERIGEDTTSSSSEEEKEAEGRGVANGLCQGEGWTAPPQGTCCHGNVAGDANGEVEECNCVPTIYFSHTVEPKKVRINTGKNTTLKFSEKKEEAKRKKKSGGGSNGHALHERAKIHTPADIYRVFVDVVNGELVPRKSILKSRSRENSVCSDTSESSTADPEERRAPGRSFSHEDDGSEDGSPPGRALMPTPPGTLEQAFSGMVVEKDPVLMPSVPHLTLAPPALPTIPERKSEELSLEADPPRRVSKFKAARMQPK